MRSLTIKLPEMTMTHCKNTNYKNNTAAGCIHQRECLMFP